METITYTPIGVIHSPFKDKEGMPIQPPGAQGIAGTVELDPKYAEGLNDLEDFSHIILLYHFDRSEGYSLTVKPFLDDAMRGVFATRAPKRPNAIGLSVVKLVKRAETVVHIEHVDIVDGTPLLDIKPYIPEFDVHPVERIGWVEKAKGKVQNKRSDNRF
jgi:tRNA-Thr(GGU) m(6)t(6)A37 methyltransferase TsaA